MEITVADVRDVPAIAKLERECFSTPWSQKAVADSLADPATILLVARIDGETVGYVGMNTVLDEGYINNVAVSPAYRRRKIATALISRLVSEARARALSFITLEVRQSNEAAKALYHSFGFKKEGTRRGFYQQPCEDADIMTKRFEEEK